MKKYIQTILVLVLISACSGNDDGAVFNPTPLPPTVANLIFPDNNLECNQGTNITDTESTVEFRWEASDNTDMYEVVVTDLITGTSVNSNTSETKADITIKRATPYSWYIISKSSVGSTESPTWKFYNAGDGITSYAPFPATIVSPEVGESVTANAGSEVTLTWSSADVDGDLTLYTIFSGTELDNISSVGRVDTPEDTSYNLSVRKGITYYWKVVSTDSKGNTSESSLASFTVNP